MKYKNKIVKNYFSFLAFLVLAFGLLPGAPAKAGEITGWVGSWTNDGNMTDLG